MARSVDIRFKELLFSYRFESDLLSSEKVTMQMLLTHVFPQSLLVPEGSAFSLLTFQFELKVMLILQYRVTHPKYVFTP